MDTKRAQWVNMESQMLRESHFLQHRDLLFLVFLSFSLTSLYFSFCFQARVAHILLGSCQGAADSLHLLRRSLDSSHRGRENTGMLGKWKVRSTVHLGAWSHHCGPGTHSRETVNGKNLDKGFKQSLKQAHLKDSLMHCPERRELQKRIGPEPAFPATVPCSR